MELLNQDTFKEKVENSKGLVLVDFFATWCGPCRMLSPILEDVSQDNIAPIYKIDVDDEEELSKQFGVLSIPTLVLFENGQEKQRINGFVPKQKIIEMLNNK